MQAANATSTLTSTLTSTTSLVLYQPTTIELLVELQDDVLELYYVPVGSAPVNLADYDYGIVATSVCEGTSVEILLSTTSSYDTTINGSPSTALTLTSFQQELPWLSLAGTGSAAAEKQLKITVRSESKPNVGDIWYGESEC